MQQEREKLLEVLYQFMDEDGQLPSVENFNSHPLIKELSEKTGRSSDLGNHIMRLRPLLNSLTTEQLIKLHNGTLQNEELNRIVFSICSSDLNGKCATLEESLDCTIAAIHLMNMQRMLFSLPPISATPAYPTIYRLNPTADMKAVAALLPILTQCGVRAENMRDIFSNVPIRLVIDVTSRHLITGNLEANSANQNIKEYLFYDLVSHLDDINSPLDEDGRTLLMFCSMMGNLERVKFLCANGARASTKDAMGKSAPDYAEEFGRDQITTFLKQQDIQTKINQLKNIFDDIESNPELPDDILALIHQLSCSDEEMATLSSRFENPEHAKQYYMKLHIDGARKFFLSRALLERGVQVPQA